MAKSSIGELITSSGKFGAGKISGDIRSVWMADRSPITLTTGNRTAGPIGAMMTEIAAAGLNK
jgi:hypothetical protein